MKSKLSVACAVLLAVTSVPAWALTLGEIQVKSALNQPLVAAIPLHPKNLTELDGLKVGLASAEDFARAGLTLTATDQSLHFRILTDNNGQKLVLVTSSQPVSDPYLDFLVQVDTRAGRQLHEFVALLNPVIEAPAPVVQAAPVGGAEPAAPAPAVTEPAASAEPPAQPSAPPAESKPVATPVASAPAPAAAPAPPPKPVVESKPVAKVQPAAKPAPTHAAPAAAGGQIRVQPGDTLSGIAQEASAGTGASLDQMMLALQAANPQAFYKSNINNLRAGAILRVPTEGEIGQHDVAAAAAAVRQQYESWRAAKPRPATVVAGAAAEAAARAQPKAAPAPPTSDHLTLAAPTGSAGAGSSQPGVAGGHGQSSVAAMQKDLRADRDTLVSLNQANADLEARVHVLQDISQKTDKLLSLKNSTIAELQRKLAATEAGRPAATVAAQPTATQSAKAGSASPHATVRAPWYARPVAWIIGGLIVLALLVLGLIGWRKRPAPEAPAYGPLTGTDDDAASPPEAMEGAAVEDVVPETTDVEADVEAEAEPEAHAETDAVEPEPVRAPVADAVPEAVEAAPPVTPVEPAPAASNDDPYGLAALRGPARVPEPPLAPPVAAPLPPIERVLIPPPSALLAAPVATAEVDEEDAVDTKLDLARAYLDMGDPVGARAMLEEVLSEGSQMQKDAARRLLVEVTD